MQDILSSKFLLSYDLILFLFNDVGSISINLFLSFFFQGGWSECFWSEKMQKCLSPSYAPLKCLGGVCGSLLSGSKDQCPTGCDSHQKAHSYITFSEMDYRLNHKVTINRNRSIKKSNLHKWPLKKWVEKYKPRF